ncbi:MAG: hypothetical protein ACLVJO_13315 [[Clostridium] scindens]
MGYQTYYRMVGTQTGNKKPLILLHGGQARPIIILRFWIGWQRKMAANW